MRKFEKFLILLFLALTFFLGVGARDKTFRELSPDTSPTADDLLITLDDPSGTPQNKKVTVNDLRNALYGVKSIDSSVPDQGVYTTGSVKHYVDGIGTSKSATLLFGHDGTGNTTTYTFSTSETIPSNIRVIREEGAILHFNDGATLTQNGPFESPLSKAFTWTGTGKIIFGSGAIKEAYPQWWAAYSDGTHVTETTAAINAAIVAFNDIFFPFGSYLVNPITIRSVIHLHGGSQGPFFTTLVGNTATGILNNPVEALSMLGDLEIDHLNFKGVGSKAIYQTNPTAYSVLYRVHHCTFDAELAECLSGNFILCNINDNVFGYYGTPGATTRHIYSKGDVVSGFVSNANKLVSNRFFHATGTESVYFEAGADLYISNNNFESNSGRALTIKGMKNVSIKDNWFEANDSTSPIYLSGDTSATIGNDIVEIDGNTIHLHANTTHFINLAGLSVVTSFSNNWGSNWAGKSISTDDTLIAKIFENYFAGIACPNKTELNPDIIDYTLSSTITGWSELSAKFIFIQKTGRLVFVNFELYDATHCNSTVISFTVPYEAAASSSHYQGIFRQAYDNDVAIVGACCQIAQGTKLVTCHKTEQCTANSWTNAANRKSGMGSIVYLTND